MYHSFIKVDQSYHVPYIYLYGVFGVIQQSVCETKIHDIDDLRRCLIQTCFEFDRNIVNAGVTI